MNFIGGNNYLSDPDSDAELASMTGGDDSSFYLDSEAGSESVYSGGMELSDYELDSQCGGDTDAAILQMGGYQSDENVVVPTVAEQKGGASSSTPTTPEAEAAVAVSAASQQEVKKPVPDQKQSEEESKADDQKEVKLPADAGGDPSVNSHSNQQPPEFTEKEFDLFKKKINFDKLLGSLKSYDGLNKQNINVDELIKLCMANKDELYGNPEPTIPEDKIKEFVTNKINELVIERANADNLAEEDGQTHVKKNDQLIRTFVKCKILSHLLMSGFNIPTDMTITAKFNKNKDNIYNFIFPLERGSTNK